MQVASHRLIDAAAQLGPGDRAFMSLLINHGLGDEELARAMRTDSEQISVKRAELASRLGAILELPAEFVEVRLAELAAAARANHDEAADGVAQAIPSTNGPVAKGDEGTEAGPEVDTKDVVSGDATAAEPETARRRRGALLLGLLALILVIALIVVLSSGGGSHGSKNAAHKPTTTAPATPAPSAPQGRTTATLSGLPAGPTGVTGAIALSGSTVTPRLVVTYGGLPSPAAGRYELWLFNSVIDALPLGTLSSSSGTAAVVLPSDYRRFRWIDISFQPPGSTTHSGLSVLRANVPGHVAARGSM